MIIPAARGLMCFGSTGCNHVAASMLPIPSPPAYGIRVRSNDPDEVTSWTQGRDGDHSRVVHDTGPYDFDMTVLQGSTVNMGWGRANLSQTLRARFLRPHLQVALEAPQQYLFGRKVISADPGTPAFVGSGTDAARRSSPSWMFSLDCSDELLEHEVRARCGAVHSVPAPLPRCLRLSPLLLRGLGDAITNLKAAHDPLAPPALRAHGEIELIGALAAALAVGLRESKTATRRLSAQRLSQLENWIDEHLAEPITIGTLCGIVGTGVRSLQLAFNARRGISPMRFVTERRLSAAYFRLSRDEADADITSVAADLGFTHLGRFSKLYFESFGELPSRTRSRHARGAVRERLRSVARAARAPDYSQFG